MLTTLKAWFADLKAQRDRSRALLQRASRDDARPSEHGHPHVHADGIAHTHGHGHGDHDHDHTHG